MFAERPVLAYHLSNLPQTRHSCLKITLDASSLKFKPGRVIPDSKFARSHRTHDREPVCQITNWVDYSRY